MSASASKPRSPAAVSLCLLDGRTLAEASLGAYLAWLGESELARYRRFVRQERRRQFVLGRVLARQCIGRLLGVAPRELAIADVPGGAPRLLAPHRAHFSISHSGPWIACAVSAGTAVGLDIEMIDPARDIAALAAQAFDSERCAWLQARPQDTRLRDFYSAWSAHEAQVKLGVPAAQTVELDHPALSVVLCSADALARAPRLETVSLD